MLHQWKFTKGEAVHIKVGHCGAVLEYCGNTTNLALHLKSQHLQERLKAGFGCVVKHPSVPHWLRWSEWNSQKTRSAGCLRVCRRFWSLSRMRQCQCQLRSTWQPLQFGHLSTTSHKSSEGGGCWFIGHQVNETGNGQGSSIMIPGASWNWKRKLQQQLVYYLRLTTLVHPSCHLPKVWCFPSINFCLPSDIHLFLSVFPL